MLILIICLYHPWFISCIVKFWSKLEEDWRRSRTQKSSFKALALLIISSWYVCFYYLIFIYFFKILHLIINSNNFGYFHIKLLNWNLYFRVQNDLLCMYFNAIFDFWMMLSKNNASYSWSFSLIICNSQLDMQTIQIEINCSTYIFEVLWTLHCESNFELQCKLKVFLEFQNELLQFKYQYMQWKKVHPVSMIFN